MRAHGLLRREGQHYTYRLTDKGVKVAVLWALFHQRLCGPLAHSLLRCQPDRTHLPTTKLEAAARGRQLHPLLCASPVTGEMLAKDI